MITVEFDSPPVQQALLKLLQRAENPRPVLLAIGGDLSESTKHRFETETDPLGRRWAENATSTKASKEKRGKPQIILTDEGSLRHSITYQLMGDGHGVDIGSTLAAGSGANGGYAAMMQFGGTQAEFPNLRGNIPERPYLGLSPDDEQSILDAVNAYILGSIV